MPVSIRTVASVTLPCAAALAGYWWYVSRKTKLIAGLDEDVPPLQTKTAELRTVIMSEAASVYASAAMHWEMLSAADLLTGHEEIQVATLVTSTVLEPSRPQVEVPPPSFPCLVPTTPAPLPGPETEGHSGPLENGQPEDLAESTNIEVLQRIADGLVSKVISAAIQEVLNESQGSDAIKEKKEEDGAGKLSEPCSPQVKVPPPSLPCLVPTTPAPLPGPETEGHSGRLENGLPEDLAENTNIEVLQRIADGLVAKVISAAIQEVLTESQGSDAIKEEEEEDGAGRLSEPCSPQVEVPPPSFPCLVPTTPAASARSETTLVATPPCRAKIQLEECIASTSDSGYSSCHSENTTPGSKKDLINNIRSEICAQTGIKLGQDDKEGRSSMLEAGLPQLHDVNSSAFVESGCTLGSVEDQHTNGQTTHLQYSQLVIWWIELPEHLAGRFIGKQGRKVKFLKQKSGAKISVSTLPNNQEFQICHIEGTQQQVDRALALIRKKFSYLDLTNLYCPPQLPITLPSLPVITRDHPNPHSAWKDASSLSPCP